MNIVLASHTRMGSTFVVGSHHLAREFVRRGHRVAHISSPISPAHFLHARHSETRARIDVWKKGAIWRGERLVELVPMAMLPWKLARYLPFGRARTWLTLNGIAESLKQLDFATVDLLFVDQPKMVGIEEAVRASHTIYRATDLYGEMEGDARLLAAERRIAERAELVVGTSEPVLEALRQGVPAKRYLLLENGVEFERFSAPTGIPKEYGSIAEPRLVYAGALDFRFDFGLVEHVAGAIRDANFVLIGPVKHTREISRLRAMRNVHLLGSRPYETIPGYYQHGTVGLLPLSAHPANAGRSPMKLYEYGAARLPVVAVWSRELARRGLPFVRLASGAVEFAHCVEEFVCNEGMRRATGAQAYDFSKGMSWALVAEKLLAAIEPAGCDGA